MLLCISRKTKSLTYLSREQSLRNIKDAKKVTLVDVDGIMCILANRLYRCPVQVGGFSQSSFEGEHMHVQGLSNVCRIESIPFSSGFARCFKTTGRENNTE